MTLSHGLGAGYLQWQQQRQELGTIAATLLRSCMAAGQASVVATRRQHDGGRSMITDLMMQEQSMSIPTLLIHALLFGMGSGFM